MTSTTLKPVIFTKSGQPLLVAPGSEEPVPVEKWLENVREWRERNRALISEISVEEFLADKRADGVERSI